MIPACSRSAWETNLPHLYAFQAPNSVLGRLADVGYIRWICDGGDDCREVERKTMKVLITGAAGGVARILRPHLEAVHACTWLDILPPSPEGDQHLVVDVLSQPEINEAMTGQDAVIQLIMAPLYSDPDLGKQLSVHVHGMATVLEAAVKNRVSRVIYASSLSVYHQNWKKHFDSEEITPEAVDPYGLTKQLGEQVCRTFAAAHDWMSIIALRMVRPKPEEKWEVKPESDKVIGTGPKDLGRLYLATLALDGHHGFDAVHASSDRSGKHLNMSKAKALLGWAPQGT